MFRGFRSALAIACLAPFLTSPAATAEIFRCTATPHEPFLDQANRFVLASLRYQPVEATQAGDYGDANAPLDTQLDDSSPATIAAERGLFLSGRLCFAAAKASTPEEVADLALLRNNIESTLFQLNALQSYRYRPQDYVEMIGSGLFFPLTSTDGTEQARLTAVLARMEKIPRVLEEARQNVKEADPVFINTALDEDSGNLGVIEQIASIIPAGPHRR